MPNPKLKGLLMHGNKLFWHGNMIGAVAGWCFILWGAATGLTGAVHVLWVVVALLWIVGHPFELVFALPVARKAGFPVSKAVIMTLVFGITWWLPVKLGVFKP